MIVFAAVLFRKSTIMKRQFDVTTASLGYAIRWCLLLFAIIAAAKMILTDYSLRLTLFVLAVVAERATHFSAQQSAVRGPPSVPALANHAPGSLLMTPDR